MESFGGSIVIVVGLIILNWLFKRAREKDKLNLREGRGNW
jgi:hypothetical protein